MNEADLSKDDLVQILAKLAKTLAVDQPLSIRSWQLQHYRTARELRFNSLVTLEYWDLRILLASSKDQALPIDVQCTVKFDPREGEFEVQEASVAP